MRSRRPSVWLLVAAAGLVHGGFWLSVTSDMRLQTAVPAGPAIVATVAFVLGGGSVLAFFHARPLGIWSYVGVVAAVAVGGLATAVSEDLLGLDVDNPLLPVSVGILIALALACYLAWMVAHPRWSIPLVTLLLVFGGGVWAGIGLAGTNSAPDVHVEPDLGAVQFPDWKMGDVHVHAAGDRDLVEHPDCRKGDGFLEGVACARQLVGLTADAATKSNAKWVILVEHGAWLAGGLDFDEQKGIEEWDQLRTAAEELAPSSGVRMLMGEELGSAVVSFAGHFSAYTTPSYVPNSVSRVHDIRYVEAVAAMGGWGAINHPFQGGNKWECWYPGGKCGNGAVSFAAPVADDPATFRALELTNGGDFPTENTLEMWDELLVQGYRVFGVGGSDAHTRSRDSTSVLHARVGFPNIAKIGISRTYAFVPEDITPTEGYVATDPNDPVREAIYSGAVVASNGPRALAVIDDAGPGRTAGIPQGDVTVDVGVSWPEQFSEEHTEPDQVRVTYSNVVPECGRECPRALSIVRDVPPASDYMTVPLAIPAEWDRAYVRVEVMTAGDDPLGAFVSPIFLERIPEPDES